LSFESQKSFPGVWHAKFFLHRILTACFFAQECDICGAQLLKRYIDQRNILQIAKDVSLRTKKQGDNNVDPRLIEEYLEEIVSICQVSIKYNRYLKERLHSKEASLHILQQQATVAAKNFDGEHYFRVLHEMVGFYIRLEEFYMYETVAVAIKINESGETLTSSVVDDVFYILQKCARRASETGSIQAVCASLHHVSNILSDQVGELTRLFQRNQASTCTFF
jgi:hypothetical protein